MDGVDAARDQLLQGEHDGRERHDGVADGLRVPGVPAAAVDHEVEVVGRRVDEARRDGDDPRLDLRLDVGRDDRDGPELAQHAARHHVAGARRCALLPRLEQGRDRAGRVAAG